MDAVLGWTAVGSAAAVAGVVVAVAASVTQGRSKRKARANIRAELGIGQLAQTGELVVSFPSAGSRVMTLPERNDPTTAEEQLAEEEQPELFGPVNVILIQNQGFTDVTISLCQYTSDFGGVHFTFNPEPGASTRGDLLPKRLASGEEAVLLHNLLSMRVFLNHVLLDHEQDCAIFDITLILGNGEEVAVPTSIHIRADMSEYELDESHFKLTRHELQEQPEFADLMLVPRQRR